MNSITLATLKELAFKEGLTVLAVRDIVPLKPAADALRLWQGNGYAGEMKYMLREPELLSDPCRVAPFTKSVVVFAVDYSSKSHPELKSGYGRVARYAWGKDYHTVLRNKLRALVNSIESHLGRTISCRVFSDSVPLLERALAADAGLGFVGKNTFLIRPRYGSNFFIAEILWDIELESEKVESSGSCGTCSRCISSCPTGAIVDEYQLDARKCISYLSIEKRGALKVSERRAIGEWVFGCDICQDVCPFNHASQKEALAAQFNDFDAESGVGPLLNLRTLIELRSESEFKRLFSETALMRAGREGLVRNALLVAANTGACELASAIVEAAQSDSSAVVRSHAFWSLAELGRRFDLPTNGLRNLADKLIRDVNSAVREEVENELQNS